EDHHIGKQLLAQLLGGAVSSTAEGLEVPGRLVEATERRPAEPLVIIVWTFLISYAFWLLLAAAECVKSLELERLGSS
ncbi:unnamed protein product, partial [Durusdinium trenchii]